MRKMKMAACLALCAAMLLAGAALADGYSSAYGDGVQYAQFTGWYEDFTSAEGLNWADSGNRMYVTCVKASLWNKPKTLSTRLKWVPSDAVVEAHLDDWGTPVSQDGFYYVHYDGVDGWINQVYTAYKPLEIVMMESGAPAYSAPSTKSKRVGELSKLSRHKVIGFYHDYYVISLRQAAAFVPMSAKHYDSTFEASHKMRASAKALYDVELRSGPGSRYVKVGDLKAGKEFLVFDQIDGWYMLIDEKTGCYVYAPADAVQKLTDWASPY